MHLDFVEDLTSVLVRSCMRFGSLLAHLSPISLCSCLPDLVKEVIQPLAITSATYVVSKLSSSMLKLNSHSMNLKISSSSSCPGPSVQAAMIWSLIPGSSSSISRISSSPGFLVPCLARFQNNAGWHPSTWTGLKLARHEFKEFSLKRL